MIVSFKQFLDLVDVLLESGYEMTVTIKDDKCGFDNLEVKVKRSTNYMTIAEDVEMWINGLYTYHEFCYNNSQGAIKREICHVIGAVNNFIKYR